VVVKVGGQKAKSMPGRRKIGSVGSRRKVREGRENIGGEKLTTNLGVPVSQPSIKNKGCARKTIQKDNPDGWKGIPLHLASKRGQYPFRFFGGRDL